MKLADSPRRLARLDIEDLFGPGSGPIELPFKLKPFEPVVQKAQRLIASLNRKLKPKSVRLNVDTGYEILTASRQPLALSMLSSGEQHELVLLHELLFDVEEGSLILIDELELSLHVTWQEEFLPDIREIATLSSLDFLVATHSPYIVGEHDALMVKIGKPAEAV